MMRYPFERVQVITQEYGENPGGYARFGMVAHNGIDFGCVSGTNVLCVEDGTVERADFDENGYGFFVQVKHAGGLTSVYAHLSQIRVTAHAAVKAGQLLGQSGSTGNSTGPHLHFEVRRQGLETNGFWGAIDPRPLLDWPGKTAAPSGPGVAYVVKVAELNVRNGAGLGSAIVGKLHAGDEIAVVEVVTPEVWGRLADGRWVALEYKGSVLAGKKTI